MFDLLTDIIGTKEYRKPEWVTHMEELKEALRGNNVVSSCMPEHDNDVMSVDSLESASVHRQHAHVGLSRKRREFPVGSETSLGDVSIGDDSVFVSNASSCSDDLHSTKTIAAKSTLHAPPASTTPFLLNQSEPSPDDCQLSISLSPCVKVTSPDSEPITNVETGNVATGSDFAQLIITDYLNSHRLSITAAIEALDMDETGKKSTSELHDSSKEVKTEVRETTQSIDTKSESFVQTAEVIAVERPVLHLHQRKERSEEVVEIIYVSEHEDSNKSHSVSNSFYLLSPIQESSEPSTESSCNGGSNGVGIRRTERHESSTIKLLSASCEAIPTIDASMTSELQTKYLTFPRSKIPVLSPMRTNACYSVPEDPMMYPLEPRELDPAGFHQLHMADSQEELQEFLLLESQCMTTDGQGLAAAFVTSDEEHFHSDGDEQCTMSGITCSYNHKIEENNKYILCNTKNRKRKGKLLPKK